MKQILFTIIILALPMLSYSCSCIDPYMGHDSDSDAIVFQGKVLSINKRSDAVYKYEVVFKVKKAIKGLNEQQVRVNVPSLGDSDCGIPFKKGKKYEVFAYKEQEVLCTNICTFTKRISGLFGHKGRF